MHLLGCCAGCPSLLLYFDNNVYDLIEKCNEAPAVGRWLGTQGHQVIVSTEANLGELISINDGDKRERLIRCVRAVGAKLSDPPADFLMAKEVLEAIAEQHPGWIKDYPRIHDSKQYLRERRNQVWPRLREDPRYQPTGWPSHDQWVRRVVGANKEAQKKRRELKQGQDVDQLAAEYLTAVDPSLSSPLASYSRQERYVRAQLFMELTLLFHDRNGASAETVWLAPHLDLRMLTLSNSGWARFWAVELSLAKVPLNVLTATIEYCQLETQATYGNTMDRIHGVYLGLVDAIITADKSLFKAMECTVRHGATRGRPLLIDGGTTSVLSGLQRLLSPAESDEPDRSAPRALRAR